MVTPPWTTHWYGRCSRNIVARLAETRRRAACRPHSPAELTGPTTGVVELQSVTRARFSPWAGRAVVSQAAFASSGTLCFGLVKARSWAV
jgi:hypothetical protein